MAEEKSTREQIEEAAPGDPALPGDRVIVVVNNDCEHDGVEYKAGNHDLPVDVAEGLVEATFDDDAPKAQLAYGKGRQR